MVFLWVVHKFFFFYLTSHERYHHHHHHYPRPDLHPSFSGYRSISPWGKCKAGQRLLEDPLSVSYRLDGAAATPVAEGALPKEDKPLANKGVCCVVGHVDKPPPGAAATRHELQVEVLGGVVFISHLLWF